ncbi:hypothetical protein LRS74_21625 [Streptomyces sp. LX-29]|uniref:hypothetical protein n=1 Tax=Streptomyces sp. LX-29 TaxID=2900152 RepID=UPI00240E45C6|nr:hypothetical protein [Streptomyces sp. LX-29]WFB09351.1 hypothetical protein LRS74_21625 [Streptomyces sp. LX-29]
MFSHRGNPPQQHWIDKTTLVGDGEMIAIGGGATATDADPGALLTASYPNDDLSGWVVSSKDHLRAHAHELTSYVIGLKIAGLSRAQLLRSVYVSRADSGAAPHPEAEAGIPSSTDYVLVGGGFRVDWHGQGNLGTASFPATEFSWKARSKDHLVSDPANIRAYAIALRRHLPVGRVDVAITRADSGQTAHPAAVAAVAPGYALTGGGGDVHWRGDGNLLWRLEPATSRTPSFSAAAKDHLRSDPASITAYALGVRIV